MGRISKTLALLLALIITTSSLTLLTVKPVNAQSMSKPSVTDFTLRIGDYAYDVPAITYTKDPYTGKNTTLTVPGHHVNARIEAVIKNPPNASYYNFRYKEHNNEDWSYEPFNPNASKPYFLSDANYVPYQATNSEYSVFSLWFLPQPPEGQVDVQVQALYGNFDAVLHEHMLPLSPPPYDFSFKGDTSDWSDTQTLFVNETFVSNSPNPTITPSVPEYSWLMILPLILSLFFVAVIINHRITVKSR